MNENVTNTRMKEKHQQLHDQSVLAQMCNIIAHEYG